MGPYSADFLSIELLKTRLLHSTCIRFSISCNVVIMLTCPRCISYPHAMFDLVDAVWASVSICKIYIYIERDI